MPAQLGWFDEPYDYEQHRPYRYRDDCYRCPKCGLVQGGMSDQPYFRVYRPILIPSNEHYVMDLPQDGRGRAAGQLVFDWGTLKYIVFYCRKCGNWPFESLDEEKDPTALKFYGG